MYNFQIQFKIFNVLIYNIEFCGADLVQHSTECYGVATTRKLLQMIGLFGKRAL